MEKEKKTTKKRVEDSAKAVRRLSTPAIVAITLFSVFFVVFLAYHGYMLAKSTSIRTEIAFPDSVETTLDVKVFVVRDEKIINETKGDNIVSAVSNGTRVSVNDTIAYSFADSTSAGNLIRMNEIKELLDYYNSLNAESGHLTNDTTLLDGRIMSSLNDFSKMVSSGDLSVLSDEQKELRDAITSKQTAMGVELDLTGVIDQLNDEYSRLSASTSRYSEIKSTGTGYYIDGTDGCENALDYNKVDEWTVEDIENALAMTPNDSDAGRLVHGYYWYLACVIDQEDVGLIEDGNFYMVSFPDSAVDDIRTQVIVNEYDEKTQKAVVVLRCIVMNEELAGLRIENARIITDKISGFRVNNDAFRSNENNERGVFVVDKGTKMVFRKVIVNYPGDEYSIVEDVRKREGEDKLDDEDSYLSMYDEYIVEGRDLAHGKLIDK